MSKKFNPVSTAVALATAALMVAVGGCAMGTNSADRNTERIAQAGPTDPSDSANQNLPSTTAASADTSGTPATGPAAAPQEAQSGIATEPGASSMQGSTSTAYPDNSAQSQPSSTAYPSTSTATATSSATYPATPESSSGMNPAGVNSANTTPSDSSMSSSSSTTTSTDTAALPPRTDRN